MRTNLLFWSLRRAAAPVQLSRDIEWGRGIIMVARQIHLHIRYYTKIFKSAAKVSATMKHLFG